MNRPRDPAEPAPSRRRRWTSRLGLALLVPIVLFGLSLGGFLPWSGINSWGDEVDLNSGRIRDTRRLFWWPVASSVRNSALTRALEPEDLAGRPADWRRVNTFSPGLRHSPHHRFHGAIAQIRRLEICWEFGAMTPAARRESARQVLRRWQETGGYFGARAYLDDLWERARPAQGTGKSLDVDDLPDPATIAR